MARDGTDTRDALLTAGQRLFAERGVYQVPLKAIVDAAGQRNASALHYHFGNREGLLQAILDIHNATIEAERKEMLDLLPPGPTLRGVVETFVIPFSRKLDSAEGREFLRIVAHLVDAFDFWDVAGARTPPQAGRTLTLLGGQLAGLDPLIRHDRITLFLGLVADGLATHARRLDRHPPVLIGHTAFLGNLIDMSVGALSVEPGGLRNECIDGRTTH